MSVEGAVEGDASLSADAGYYDPHQTPKRRKSGIFSRLCILYNRMDVSRGEIDRLIGIHGTNNPDVLEAMVVQYGAPVYKLALSILGDSSDAQDAAQDTFMQAASALHRYQVGTNFKAWLLRITINNCRMTLRRRAARRAMQQAWQALTTLRSRQTDSEAQLVQDETRRELWDLVDQLDDKHRLVIVLRLAHNMTVSEISQVLGVKEKTIYTRLYTAIEKLRAQMRNRAEFSHYWDEV